MDKIYLVGGLDGKAFPSVELARAYAATRSKLSINEISFIDSDIPVKGIKGCILHFDYEKNYDVKPYFFNDLDNKPQVRILLGYGKYRLRLVLPIEKSKLTKDIINNIMTFSLPAFKKYDFTYNQNRDEYKQFIEAIENIIKGCDEAYMAKIILSFS